MRAAGGIDPGVAESWVGKLPEWPDWRRDGFRLERGADARMVYRMLEAITPAIVRALADVWRQVPGGPEAMVRAWSEIARAENHADNSDFLNDVRAPDHEPTLRVIEVVSAVVERCPEVGLEPPAIETVRAFAIGWARVGSGRDAGAADFGRGLEDDADVWTATLALVSALLAADLRFWTPGLDLATSCLGAVRRLASDEPAAD